MLRGSCATRISTLPPSWMSVPRPAMLVAMVMAPGTPASATMIGLLLVEAGVQHLRSAADCRMRGGVERLQRLRLGEVDLLVADS
jgi:hypothetical protein